MNKLTIGKFTEELPDAIIKELKLRDEQVWSIVLEWYNEMYKKSDFASGVLRDENEMDLKKICELWQQNLITKESIESLGFKLTIKGDGNYDYTFNHISKKVGWIYVLVWQPVEKEIIICHHKNIKIESLGFNDIERLFKGVVNDIDFLKQIIKSVIR